MAKGPTFVRDSSAIDRMASASALAMASYIAGSESISVRHHGIRGF